MTIDLDALECRVDSCLGQTIIISTAKVHELIQRLREAEAYKNACIKNDWTLNDAGTDFERRPSVATVNAHLARWYKMETGEDLTYEFLHRHL